MKVLQIIDGEEFGGIAKIIEDIEKNITKDIKFDFLTSIPIKKDWKNLNISRKTIKGRTIYNYRLHKFLKKNKYDIVHINSGAFFFTFFCVITCKLSRIKKIIVHSHNAPNISKTKKMLIKIPNPLYRKMTNVHLSCSGRAARSLFTKTEDVRVVNNGIDVDKFKYNKNTRNEYRKKLKIENKIVYGHIGRFNKQKNHTFLIDLFYEIQKKQDAVLLLIGNGELENEIKEKVNRLKIKDKVIFLGFRKDVYKLLNAMDIFLFPSLYEGLGIAVIESLTSGLPTFVSKEIPEEANISNNLHKMNSYNIEEWKKQILNVKLKDRTNEYKKTIEKKYDIKTTSKQLEQIYEDLIK